jgi:TolA-binding protein
MTDPKRLLLDEGSEAERQLLAAGAAEEPPADGARRLAIALGVGTAGTAVLTSAGSAKAAGGSVLSKLAGTKLAVTAALALGAGALVVLSGRAPVSRPEPALPAPSAPARSAPEAADVDPPPSSADRAPERRLAAPGVISIADEVTRLDAVRRALAKGALEQARAGLDAYGHSYPRGTLAPEALRLRIELSLQRGDARYAQALAREFLRAYPDSPHVASLRRIAEREPAEAPGSAR